MAKREIIEGQLCGNERGYAFLIPNDRDREDYFIPHSDLRGAMHGDFVMCETTCGTGARTTARVLKIVKRGISELVGTYMQTRTGGFVCPDDRRYFCDIFIPNGKQLRARSGDKVVCKITYYPKRLSPEGIITSVLGKQFNKQAELKSLLFTYDLADKFTMATIEEAKKVGVEPTEKDFEGRKDYRNLLTFTIDGEDAKDFDDAVSIERLDGKKYRLGVHIADVSHYVESGGAIDDDAYFRGTSVYFPESVIPMLPEVLCNDVCSLREGVDRLTMSCVMVINSKGVVEEYEIMPSVINSSARMTYNQVQAILDGDKDVTERFSKQAKSLEIMNELADILIARRDEQGSIDLDVKESTILVDKKGKIDVVETVRDKAHRIIEEFMIIANVTVAEYAFYLDCPFIYRIHSQPTQERLENFYSFVNGIGLSVRRKKDQIFSKDFQSILKKAEQTPFATIINRVMLRSMQKAKYSEVDEGHFGLSLAHYCHFTSPIRRYPDLVIHRILKDIIKGDTDVYEKYADFVVDASIQASEKERNATEAERAVDDYYKLLYISDYVGEEFDAVVSGVTGFGLFAELKNGVEGIIKIETIGDKGNKLIYNPKTFTLSNDDMTFRLGQPVKIKVVGVDLADRRAEFMLINNK